MLILFFRRAFESLALSHAVSLSLWVGGVSEGTVTPGAELWLRDSCRAVERLIWLPGLQGSAIISSVATATFQHSI